MTGISVDSTSCRTLFLQSDLGVVGSEAGEVLLLVCDQRQQHDVSGRQEGQRGVRVSALSEEEAQRRVTRGAVRRANISSVQLHLNLQRFTG